MKIPFQYPFASGLSAALAVKLFLSLLITSFVFAPFIHAQETAQPSRSLDVPYVPTPQPVVEKMLEMANVKKGDVVYDLGCGDGRIVIAAVKDRGAARGVCVDLNPQRINEAKMNAQKAKVEDRIKFINGDLFTVNFSEATVVTLYLLPSVNVKLRPQLWRQLKVGTRVVSHAFDMGSEWPAEKTEQVGGTTIYFWTITDANKKAAASSSGTAPSK